MKPQPDDGCPRHTICPGVPCPQTVLAGRMTDGSYLLVAYPGPGPAAFVVGADADLLHNALQAAFGHPTAQVAGGSRDPAPQASASPGKRVQP